MQVIDPCVPIFRNIRDMERAEASPRFQELIASVKEKGVLQPVILYKAEGEWYVKDGFRRTLAARYAGLDEIPFVEVDPPTESELLIDQLVLNLTQQELNPIEQAKAFAELVSKYGISQKAIAASLGKSDGYISHHSNLLRLPPEIQQRVEQGILGYRAAYELSTLPKIALQMEAVKGIRTIGQARRFKRAIAAARETQIKLAIPDIDLEEEAPDENTVMVFSLMQMATDMLERAFKLAREHKISTKNQAKQIHKIIYEEG